MNPVELKIAHAQLLIIGKRLKTEGNPYEYWFLPYEGLLSNGTTYNMMIVSNSEKPMMWLATYKIQPDEKDENKISMSIHDLNYTLQSVGKKGKGEPFILSLTDYLGKEINYQEVEKVSPPFVQ